MKTQYLDPDRERIRHQILFTLILFGVVQFFVSDLNGFFFHYPDQIPWSSSMIGPVGRFDDFTRWVGDTNTYPMGHWAMPPVSILLAGFWGWIADLTTMPTALVLSTLTWYLPLLVGVFRLLQPRQHQAFSDFTYALLLLGLSYPVYFTIDRGNVSGYTAASLVWGILFFMRGQKWRSMLCFGFATNIKITPIIFSLLYLSQGMALTATIFAFSSVCVGLLGGVLVHLWINPKYNLDLFLEGLAFYVKTYAIGHAGWGYGSALLGGIKWCVWFFAGFEQVDDFMISYFSVIAILCQLLGVVTLVAMLRKGSDFIDRIVLLMTWLLLAPYVTADYQIPILFAPLSLLLANKPQRNHWPYILLITLLMTPKAYYWMTNISPAISVNTIINPILLSLLFAISLYRIFKTSSGWIFLPLKDFFRSKAWQ